MLTEGHLLPVAQGTGRCRPVKFTRFLPLNGVGRQEPETLPSSPDQSGPPVQGQESCPCCFSRLKKLPSKVLDDMDDDDDLSTDGGSLYEAPLSYTFPKDAISQI